jgi:hypothetical protein
MKSLEDDRRALPEQVVDTPGIDQIVQFPPLDARPLRIARGRDRPALPYQTNRWEPQTAFGQKAVDVAQGKQIVELVRGSPMERSPAPMLTKEVSAIAYATL